MNKVLAISTLFLAHAAAKISFGLCSVPTFKPFNDYLSELFSSN